MNLYGFIRNNGIAKWDFLGQLEVKLFSDYVDASGDDKSKNDIWNQLKKPASVIGILDGALVDIPTGKRALIHRSGDFIYGGWTRQYATALVEVDKNCKVTGELHHFVVELWMNSNPRRSPVFYEDYWATAHHELMHIKSFLNRLRYIIEIADLWNDQFETNEQAEAVAEVYQMALQKLVDWQQKREGDHENDGFHTPSAETPIPGWQEGQPD